MIFDAARAAAGQIFTAPFRAAFGKTLGLTLAALAAIWFGLKEVFDAFALPWIDALLAGQGAWADWLGLFAAILAGVVLAIAVALLIAPATAIVAGLFLDDVAEVVERETYPLDPPGRAVPLAQGIVLSLKFFAVVLAGNLLALLLLLLPGVNLVAFFAVNGYLLGREFFEFAAMRFRSEADAKALRREYAGTVFLAGLLIAAMLAVPLLNLAAPLFAAAMMVHLHKAVSARAGQASARIR